MTQQGSHPPQPGRPATPGRDRGARLAGRSSWRDDTQLDGDEESPPWAGPEISPRWADREARQRRMHGQPAPGQAVRDQPEDGGSLTDPGSGGHRAPPGFRSRLALARARRTRLMFYIWGAALVTVAVIATVVVLEMGGQPAPRHVSHGFVTTFQPGELKTVPTACTSVTAATLDQYLPGKRSMLAPRPLDGRAQSLCDWTVDQPPLYRHLEVTVQAYAPSGLAPGNGSATLAASAAYQQARQQKMKPPKATHLPKAVVTQIHGLASSAFAALQVVSAGNVTTDVMTVVARDHNVLVTVILEGLAKSANGRYGPVSVPTLQAGAVAATHDIMSRLG